MKLASILPVKNFDRMFEGDYAMMLAHLADKYPKCKNPNCYKIMDNSLIELGGAVDMPRLVEAAIKCEADEIILPDVFNNAEGTISSVEYAAEWLYKNNLLNKFRLMAVCQGKDEDEFNTCFTVLNMMHYISCIGIPKVAETKHPEGRPHFEHLWTERQMTKQIHLLGVWSNLQELLMYRKPQLIRSVDTCIPALLSKTTAYVYTDRPKNTIDLNNDEIDEENYECILQTLKGEGWL